MVAVLIPAAKRRVLNLAAFGDDHDAGVRLAPGSRHSTAADLILSQADPTNAACRIPDIEHS